MKKGKFMNEVTKERRLAKANMIFSKLPSSSLMRKLFTGSEG
jgi:hypothetical protein